MVAIPFVRNFDFEYGRADQVSPLIRRVIANNPGPFTYTGTGTYIVGHGEVAVIDPGPERPEHLEAILKAVEGERVTAILITHNHADHSPLARPLAEATGARIYGAPAAADAGHSLADLEEAHDSAFAPDVAVVVLSDVKLADDDRAAWTAGVLDLGARYVLFPPLQRPVLEDLVGGLMTATQRRTIGATAGTIDLADEQYKDE